MLSLAPIVREFITGHVFILARARCGLGHHPTCVLPLRCGPWLQQFVPVRGLDPLFARAVHVDLKRSRGRSHGREIPRQASFRRPVVQLVNDCNPPNRALFAGSIG